MDLIRWGPPPQEGRKALQPESHLIPTGLSELVLNPSHRMYEVEMLPETTGSDTHSGDEDVEAEGEPHWAVGGYHTPPDTAAPHLVGRQVHAAAAAAPHRTRGLIALGLVGQLGTRTLHAAGPQHPCACPKRAWGPYSPLPGSLPGGQASRTQEKHAPRHKQQHAKLNSPSVTRNSRLVNSEE